MLLQKLMVTAEINGKCAKCLRVKSLGLQSVFSKTVRCNMHYAENKGMSIAINSNYFVISIVFDKERLTLIFIHIIIFNFIIIIIIND